MSLRTLLAAAVALSVATAAVAEQPQIVQCKLNYVAAADAAQALARFAEQEHPSIRIVAEPISNTLILAAASAQLKQATTVLSTLDAEPPRVHVQMMLVRVPAGFAEDFGLGNDQKRVLTRREVSKLKSAIRRQKSEGHFDVLSRPELMTADNQSAQVQIGNAQSGVAATITPRISPDGAILLRVEAQVKETSEQVTTTQSVETTEKVRDGGTLVVRGMHSKDAAGDTEVLTVLTARLARPDPNRTMLSAQGRSLAGRPFFAFFAARRGGHHRPPFFLA
jgi:type II secretory pathway component GspD/PulD (secretin)